MKRRLLSLSKTLKKTKIEAILQSKQNYNRHIKGSLRPPLQFYAGSIKRFRRKTATGVIHIILDSKECF